MFTVGGGGYDEGDRLDVGVSDAAKRLTHSRSTSLCLQVYICARSRTGPGGQGTEDGALCFVAFGCIIQ